MSHFIRRRTFSGINHAFEEYTKEVDLVAGMRVLAGAVGVQN